MDNFLKADMQIEENILSPSEYRAALNGKRHFLDEAIRGGTQSAAKGRYLAAILFSDIAGYTEMMTSDQSSTLGIVDFNGTVHRQNIARFHGRFLKEMGDGVLASFPSASQAVECARSIQQDIRQDGRYSVRIGVHLGEIVQANGDVLGDGVNLAARIHGEAEPGQIVVSEVVFDNVRSLEGVKGSDLGVRSLKGVGAPVHLYEIAVDSAPGG
jgi:class 3 adenylate cyclase